MTDIEKDVRDEARCSGLRLERRRDCVFLAMCLDAPRATPWLDALLSIDGMSPGAPPPPTASTLPRALAEVDQQIARLQRMRFCLALAAEATE